MGGLSSREATATAAAPFPAPRRRLAASAAEDAAYPPFTPGRPRFDQASFTGRVRHFFEVIDPATLVASRESLDEAGRLLEEHARRQAAGDGLAPGVTDRQLWDAQKLRNAVLHPQTGEPVFPLFRMSFFVPANVPIVTGMLTTSSVWGQIAWQWINQSYNAGVNVANSNASNPLSPADIATAYCGAVGAAVGITLGLGKVGDAATKLSPAASSLLRGLVPFTAVASAGAANCYLMRKSEVDKGIDVKDADGTVRGVSREAGRLAVYQSMASRVFLPVPILAVPPVIMAGIDRVVPQLAKAPRARLVTQIGVVTGCVWGALPAAIGLFPQEASVRAEKLEPEFSGLVDKEGRPVTELFFNKGL